MTKTDIINTLIGQRGYRKYLEISMHNEQQNFSSVRCHRKRFVACDTAAVAETDYLTFLKCDTVKFDLIFIDGIHTETDALNDIQAALNNLAGGGAIILHDCLPPDAWHQRELSDYHEGENWNGTVWKAALRIFNQTNYRCTLVDTDWGCAIIDTAGSQSPVNRILPEILDYEQHYKCLLEYRISVAGFMRDQVKVFYHLACMGNWQQVYEEQLQQLRHSGFRQLSMTVLGSKEDLEKVQLTAAHQKINIDVVFNEPDFIHFEKPALLAIEAYAKHYEGYVLYLHSKGVSNPADETKTKWRRLMMRELVEKWEDCMQQLSDYDIIGVNWREMPPVSHFCGNFWYASTRYLKTLPDFNQYYQYPRFQIWDAVNHKRLGCEFWIGSAKYKPNLLSLYCRNIDFCNTEYWNKSHKQAAGKRMFAGS